MSFSTDALALQALREVPIPDFIERDVFKLKVFYVAEFERLTGRTLYPSQTEMFVIETMAYAHSVFGEAAQLAFLKNRAIWAEGAHLEQIGLNVSTPRLDAQAASCNVRFSLVSVQPNSVVVPKGTRISSGGNLLFFTDVELVIAEGEAHGDVRAVAADVGTAFNEFPLGSINALLDPVAHVATVANITESGGGADIEDQERYRLRVVNAFERISKAGPRDGYKELVKGINSAIVDVAVIKPEPGYIEITPLMLTGVSSDAVDADILAGLDPEKDVPMGDFISIVKAHGRFFSPIFNVRIVPGFAGGMAAKIEAVVDTVFARWRLSLGGQVAPSLVIAAIKALPNVVDVEVENFNYTDLAGTEFAILGNVTVNLVEAPNV